MAKRISKRLSILTEEERERQLYAEKCFIIGWELKNRGENEAAIWHFEKHLNNMLIPASPLGLIELYPEAEDCNNEINTLNKYLKVANDYNYKLYLQALKEYPELEEQLHEALETNTNLIINEKQILRQQKLVNIFGCLTTLFAKPMVNNNSSAITCPVCHTKFKMEG